MVFGSYDNEHETRDSKMLIAIFNDDYFEIDVNFLPFNGIVLIY